MLCKIEEASYKKSCKFYSGESSYPRSAGFSTWRPVCVGTAMPFPSFPSSIAPLVELASHKSQYPPPPPLQTKGIFVSISVLNDLLSGNPQNRCQGVIPFSCVYKDSLIFRQLKELFFQFYKVSSSILRPISMKSEHTQRKSIRKRPNKQLKNF